MTIDNQATVKNQFGTFGGVFTPAILTILGVIMFMRANFVVGQAGIIGATAILIIATSITFLTSLSIAAISTNMQMRGGGSYFLISRVLGPEFGGAIGIALFFALALSVPFYILGFAEALILSFPSLGPNFQIITLCTALILFGIAYFGADWAIRTQFFIMIFLFLAIFSFIGGAAMHFSLDTFQANLSSGFTAGSNALPNAQALTFWTLFAIYFPAVTGIDAGVNMSGDLDNPGRSIPRGTLAAVTVGFIVYLSQILLSGGAYERADLIGRPYALLHENALFGWTILVTLGVVAATLSSALGSLLGAPRVLQAVSRDRMLGFLHPFSKGTPKGDEPRRALILTFILTIGVLLWAGNETGGTALNGVAVIITMFFLYSYGMINLAAFTEDFSDNPSFRPTFRFFHWSSALFSAAGCLVVSMLISWPASIAAVTLLAALLWYLKTRHLTAAFGDARRGFVYRSVRNKLLSLQMMEEDPKNWRPTVLVFSGNPETRKILVTYAAWLGAQKGIVYLAYILIGDFNELAPRRALALRQLSEYCHSKNIEAFPVVVVADEVKTGVSMLLQATAVGPIHPNLAIFGWSKKSARLPAYINQLRTAASLGMSTVLLRADLLPPVLGHKRIDIWWRGQKNGGLMVLLAYLLQQNWGWQNSIIRVLRVVTKEEGREPAKKALQELINSARIQALAHTILDTGPFHEILASNSNDASCVFLGFEIPTEDQEHAWHGMYEKLMQDMPPIIMINSQGGEELLA